MALDLISQFILNESVYIERYLGMVIERSNDTSIGVRKRVVAILSTVLEQEGREDIIKILIRKWEDSSGSIRSSLVTSIKKIFLSQAVKFGA